MASDGTFNVRYSTKKDSIYQKINRCIKFGKSFKVRTGVMGFEYWKMEEFIHDRRKSESDVRIATNSYVERYCFLWGKQINLYKKKFTEPHVDLRQMPVSSSTKELYRTKGKLIVRGVARRMTAMIDTKGTAFLVAVHSIIPSQSYDPLLILGVINSSFFNWIHKDRFYLGRIPEGSLKYPVSFRHRLIT